MPSKTKSDIDTPESGLIVWSESDIAAFHAEAKRVWPDINLEALDSLPHIRKAPAQYAIDAIRELASQRALAAEASALLRSDRNVKVAHWQVLYPIVDLTWRKFTESCRRGFSKGDIVEIIGSDNFHVGDLVVLRVNKMSLRVEGPYGDTHTVPFLNCRLVRKKGDDKS